MTLAAWSCLFLGAKYMFVWTAVVLVTVVMPTPPPPPPPSPGFLKRRSNAEQLKPIRVLLLKTEACHCSLNCLYAVCVRVCVCVCVYCYAACKEVHVKRGKIWESDSFWNNNPAVTDTEHASAHTARKNTENISLVDVWWQKHRASKL